MINRRPKANVFLQLRRREYCTKTEPRDSFQTLRKLICEGCYSYRKVWEKFTNKSIASEGGKVFFENYTQCYGGYGRDSQPKHLYNLYTPNNKKINDSLLVVTQPASISEQYCVHRGSLMCIVSKRWLMRFDIKSGRLLQEVYITSNFNIRDIQWNEPQESIVLKSSQPVRPVSRPPFIPQVGVVTTLVMFDLWPLKFTGMFEVTKTVFGKDTVDAMLSQGMLITMHHSGLVRFYSLEHIIKEYRTFEPKLYEEIEELGYICGKVPDGLPLNIVIKNCPPVLFEARCDQHSIEIGGYPWHFLHTPVGHSGTFHLKSLATQTLAEHGHFEMKNMSFEPDKAIFSGDESGRVIHIGPLDIKVYRLRTDDNDKSRVEEVFCMNMEKKELLKFPRRSKQETVTSSGRQVKKRVIPDEVMEYPTFTIHNVCYEDELDILHASVVYLTRITPPTLKGRLYFHDNSTGKLLKEIPMEQKFCDNSEHQVIVDLDTVIQIIKSPQARFVCMVYRVSADLDEEDSRLRQQQEGGNDNGQKTSQSDSHTTRRRARTNSSRRREQNSVNVEGEREHRSRRNVRGERRRSYADHSDEDDDDNDEEWIVNGRHSSSSRQPRRSSRRRRRTLESFENDSEEDVMGRQRSLTSRQGHRRDRSMAVSSDEDTDTGT